MKNTSLHTSRTGEEGAETQTELALISENRSRASSDGRSWDGRTEDRQLAREPREGVAVRLAVERVRRVVPAHGGAARRGVDEVQERVARDDLVPAAVFEQEASR